MDKISKEIEILPGSDYYIKFLAENFTFEEKEINSYSFGLSKKVIDAIVKSPNWIQRKLTMQFHAIDASDAEKYADLILNASKKYVDEIAFSIACSSIGDVPPLDVIRDNVFYLYENDKWIKYADIIDYDDGKGNYYSTISYKVVENGLEKEFELPPQIYYWYVVHPEIAGEKPQYIYGKFWRDYLFNHNDIGYPLLKEKLADIEYLWDCKSYFQPAKRTWKWSMENHPTAIEAISYWIGKTIPQEAYGDRPGQPNIIAHEHNGWCGELQIIAVASMRASLIPSVGICNIGEDHVWREFYERGWHENDNWWADGGGAVDKPDVYAYEWKKNISAIFAWKGDDSIYDVTSAYLHPEDRKTICFQVLDGNFYPIDGARITAIVFWPRDITWFKHFLLDKIEKIWDLLPDFLKGKILQFLYNKAKEGIDKLPNSINGPVKCIWNYTDMNGECCFEIGKNRSYIFLIQYDNLREPWQLASYNALRVLLKPENKTYRIIFPAIPNREENYKIIETKSKEISFNISFNTLSYQIHKNALWIKDEGVYEREGKIEFFILDEENFEKYSKGRDFECFIHMDERKGNINIDLGKNNYYLLFKNNARKSNVILNFSINVKASTTKDMIKIVYPHTSIFDEPTFDIGQNIVIGGIATRDVILSIDGIQHNIEVHNYEWQYEWNTTSFEPGEYLIKAECGNEKDEILIKLVDTTSPSIKIEEPEDKIIIFRDVIGIRGVAKDNFRIKKVLVSIDGKEWREAFGKEEWYIELNMSEYNLGEHIIFAKAIDETGREGMDKISIILNESGHQWAPCINYFYHEPEEPTNESNVIIYANVTEGGAFKIEKIVLFWSNGTVVKNREMYRYGDNPSQERHEEDPLKNRTNSPIFGFELGQFSSGEKITYWIEAYDAANNIKVSDKKSFSVS
ncbi:MAG: hypothetical protein QXW78_02075 [Candidatus Thermoplasmatota archaeon]